ncbi:glucosyltransferase domain-containing protein [Erwinia amylovora]|uniref:glucosyltransferase domain-containing protein n=1 Tax=Erwinia amylovora TaxID=552 RepID=UPI00039A87C3|nr:glucosyltransferase domain-containing protein [Erwinia amylovora]
MTNSHIFSKKINDFSKMKALVLMTSVSFFLMFLGTSRTMFSVYMPDDYLLASQTMPLSFYLNQGRFVQALITFFFNDSGINIISSSPVFTPLFLLATSLTASAVIINLIPKGASLLVACLCSAVIVTHPVFSMMAVYHLATVCFSICMMCILGAIHYMNKFLEKKELQYALKTALLVVLICGNYQPAFIILAGYVVARTFIFQKKIFSLSALVSFSPLILGFILYAIFFKATKNILGVVDWDSRASLVSDIPHRLSEISNFIPSLFFKSYWVIPSQYSLMMSVCLVLFLVTYLIKQRDLPLSIYTIPFFNLFLTIAPVAILYQWDPTPRAIFSIAFFYGSCFALFYNDRFGKFKVILLSVISLLGLLSSNHYLYTTEMSQKKDKLVVYEAYSIIKNDSLEDKKIAFVNKNALDIADWAVNGAFFFLTNNNFQLTPASPQQRELCDKESRKTTSIIHTDKREAVLCLR